MKKLVSILLVVVLFSACVVENDATKTDDFNREFVLDNWVNNLIIPAYADFKVKMEDLKTTSNAFIENPNTTTQLALQISLFQTQKVWQHVAMFELQGTTRVFMNTYPIDKETSTFPVNNSNEDERTLQTNLDDSVDFINELDFTLSGTVDEQGFPVIDFLVNQENTLTNFTNVSTSENYKAYLAKVITRMVDLTDTSITYWATNTNNIIANDGSNATASFDKMINDYLNYVEQGFRENKIATPSGERVGGIGNSEAVEAYHSSENSKIYFNEAYTAVKNFYYGISYDGTKDGEGIYEYLEYLNAEVYDSDVNADVKVVDYIESSFTTIQETVDILNDDFALQVEEDNDKMTDTFDVIQEYVRLMKVDVFQIINVKIDFVDSDGD